MVLLTAAIIKRGLILHLPLKECLIYLIVQPQTMEKTSLMENKIAKVKSLSLIKYTNSSSEVLN